MIHRITDRFMSLLDRACYALTAICVIGAVWLIWRALAKMYWGTP